MTRQSFAGRKKLAPRRQLLVRLPEDLYAEVLLLIPQMLGPDSYPRYGAITQYFTALVQQDLERRRVELREKMVQQ